MSLSLKIPVGVSGLFQKIEILSPEGAVKRTYDGFPNLIVNGGLDRLASAADNSEQCYNWCLVGTGSAPPAPTDNQLQNLIGSSSSSSSSHSTDIPGGYCQVSQTWTFGVGAVVGNISELGTGWGPGLNQLFSRALILDELGNPTTISILADEQLRVSWSHRRYWPTSDVVGEIVNEGNKGGTFEYTVRAALVGQWTAGANRAQIAIANRWEAGVAVAYGHCLFFGETTLGEIEGNPTSVGGPYATGTVSSRGTSGPSATGNLSFALGQANSAQGVGGLRFSTGHLSGTGTGSLHAFQVKFDPPIPKTSQDLLEIGVVVSWGRQ